MLIQLEERLENVRNSLDLPKVIRIAAIAGLLVVEKYSKLSDLSEVYRIAMGMHFVLTTHQPLISCHSDVSGQEAQMV